jgi:hypothetical protein
MQDSTHTPARIRATVNGLVVIDLDVRTLVIAMLLRSSERRSNIFPLMIETTLPCCNYTQCDVLGDEDEDG